MSKRPVQIPGIPKLPDSAPKELRDWCIRVQQILDIRNGIAAKGTNTRFVTIQDLVDAGVVADGVIK